MCSAFPSPRGYTLIELVITLMIVGLLAALAAPRLAAPVRRLRMELALNQLGRDLFYARMVAVRSARRVEVRFGAAAAEPCITEYRIVVHEEPEREVKYVRTTAPAAGACLRKTGPDTMMINARGRPSWNYSFWWRDGQTVDSMTMTQLGRLRRWP